MNIKKITNREVAELIGKKETTIKGWSSRHPELKKLVFLGAICKKYNLSEEDLFYLASFKKDINNPQFQ